MANFGKFKDRNPNIPTAGVGSVLSDDMKYCMDYHTLAEEVEALLPARYRKEVVPPPQPSSSVGNYVGYYTEARAAVSPAEGSALDQMLQELKDSSPREGLPPGLDPLTTTFGRPTGTNIRGSTLYEEAFPDIPYGETKLQEQLGLDLYQRSHNRFLVGQKKDVKYDVPLHVIYGKVNRINLTGLPTKKCLKWFNQENVSRTSKGQARVRENSHFEIGKPLTPNNILEKVGLEHTFGRTGKMEETGGAAEGMREGPVDRRKSYNGDYVGYICRMRQSIKRRDPPFPFFDLVTNLNLLDEGGCGCLSLDLVYKVCERLGLRFDKEMLELVLRHLNVLHGENNDTVSYHGFCNILDFRKPLPEFQKVDDLPDDLKLYESAYQALTRDLQKKNEYANVRRAGLPMLRIDRTMPGDGDCKGDRFLLMDETSLDACIRPSIFSYYGLTPRDFFQPRTKEFMRDLWKNVGLEIPDNIFDEMWKEGLTRKENDGKSVCIETFRNMLDEMCEAKLVEVRES